MTPKDDDLEQRLEADGVAFKKTNDTINIFIESTLDAVELTSKYVDKMESYEVLKGSMDDVFLNITGRELR